MNIADVRLQVLRKFVWEMSGSIANISQQS